MRQIKGSISKRNMQTVKSVMAAIPSFCMCVYTYFTSTFLHIDFIANDINKHTYKVN